MGQIQIPKKIKVEDFSSKDQPLVSKLGYIINDFTESIYFLLQKGIDFTNLNRQIVTITVNMDSSAKLVNPPQIAYDLKNKPQGITCVYAQNTKDSTVFPISAPFVTWQIANNRVTLTNISGLQANSQYILSLELIG
jgi:hypothetical protein